MDATTETIRLIQQDCSEKKAPDFGNALSISWEEPVRPFKPWPLRNPQGIPVTWRTSSKWAEWTSLMSIIHSEQTRRVWLLVNGDPAMIDVDALADLPKRQLEGNPTYLRIREEFPKVILFGGDRTTGRPPDMIVEPTKWQRFIVEYRLLNGCRACESVGRARFAFDFDPNGKFLGPTLLDVGVGVNDTAKQCDGNLQDSAKDELQGLSGSYVFRLCGRRVQGGKGLGDCPHLDKPTVETFSVQNSDSRTLEREQEQALNQLRRKIAGVDLSSAAERLQASFSGERLTVKCLGKDFQVDSEGNAPLSATCMDGSPYRFSTM